MSLVSREAKVKIVEGIGDRAVQNCPPYVWVVLDDDRNDLLAAD